MKNLYEILDVPEDASESDIKKAYRKKAQANHPDKEGGDTEVFQAIQKAYEILSDENKRKHYDETGDELKDQLNNEVIESLIGIVLNVVQNSDVRRVNILDSVRALVHQQQRRHRDNQNQMEKQMERMLEASKRLSHNGNEENILKLALESQANKLNISIKEVEKVLAIGEEILNVVSNYTYQVDQMPAWGAGPQFVAWNGTGG